MACYFAKLFHLIGLGMFSYALYYHTTVISPLQNKLRGFSYGGPYIYLTILANIIQVPYYAIALYHDHRPCTKVQKIRDFLFASWALPLASLTTVMFYATTSIDRELVFPRALDEFFPRWLDLTIHTFVSIMALLDVFIAKHQYPKRSPAIRFLAFFMIGYLIWIYYVKVQTGVWVYGIIEALNDYTKIFFFAVCGLVAFGLYFFGEFLNFLFVGKDQVSKQKQK